MNDQTARIRLLCLESDLNRQRLLASIDGCHDDLAALREQASTLRAIGGIGVDVAGAVLKATSGPGGPQAPAGHKQTWIRLLNTATAAIKVWGAGNAGKGRGDKSS